jgi:hypothetical protein
MPLTRPTELAAFSSIALNHLFPRRRPAGVRFPADSWIAGATGPRHQMHGRGELRHVRTGLRDDDLRDAAGLWERLQTARFHPPMARTQPRSAA